MLTKCKKRKKPCSKMDLGSSIEAKNKIQKCLVLDEELKTDIKESVSGSTSFRSHEVNSAANIAPQITYEISRLNTEKCASSQSMNISKKEENQIKKGGCNLPTNPLKKKLEQKQKDYQ